MVSSPVEATLAAFVAGAVQPERVVIAVAAVYYGERQGSRERLRPLIDIIDRASPGIVELGSVSADPGFKVRLAERPFPKQYEADLRRAAAAVLAAGGGGGGGAGKGGAGDEERGAPVAPERGLGVVARVLRAVRQLFSASA